MRNLSFSGWLDLPGFNRLNRLNPVVADKLNVHPPLLRLVEQHEKELRLLTANRLHPRSVKCKRVRQKQFPVSQFPIILASAKAQQFGLVNNLHAELLGFVQL
jgi:hypothetical protein